MPGSNELHLRISVCMTKKGPISGFRALLLNLNELSNGHEEGAFSGLELQPSETSVVDKNFLLAVSVGSANHPFFLSNIPTKRRNTVLYVLYCLAQLDASQRAFKPPVFDIFSKTKQI
ncbi:uncharacterized protein YALI1_C26621g [Yarrowia lipolytica]|uniref:Uncharacterized protein n=1 Tax=Yarrowia lipolytica TaxID=4952 RepID=A0A1D8NBU1_YARLL|nr:hypothetical protein YALI1_C26621g [Yarrowia lipolytica]